MKYTPPHMFFGLPKDVGGGGSSGCNILAQRWYGTPFHFEHTYIHTFIHSYFHTFILVHTFIYIYIYIWHIHVLTKIHGEFLRGGSCKTMVFYSSSRVPPKKIHIANAGGCLQKNTTVKFLRGGSCKTMVFYSSSRVPPQKKSIVDPFWTFLVLTRVGPTRKPHN